MLKSKTQICYIESLKTMLASIICKTLKVWIGCTKTNNFCGNLLPTDKS